MLISPFGMTPKAMAKPKTPAKNFVLDVEEEDGYASAKSEDEVDQLLKGSWKPNYDIALDDEEDLTAANKPNEQNLLLPTVLSPTVLEPIMPSLASSDSTQARYTESDVAAMKAQWEQEREALQAKTEAAEKNAADMQQKEAEYLALITEYEATVNALEAEKNSRDSTSMEAYARKLGDLEVENAKLRGERQEMENSFQQLHKRYEQLKVLQTNAVKNEGILKQALAKSQSDFMAAEARFLRLKNHAQTQLDAANTEINRIRDEGMKKNLLLAAKLSLCQTQLTSISVELQIARTEKDTLESVVSQLCSPSPAPESLYAH